MDHLDFRVYRVTDPLAFFAGLRGPAPTGQREARRAPGADVASSASRAWKAGRRARLRAFLRGQVSRDYRAQRRASSARSARSPGARRCSHNTFAQVPLLNRERLRGVVARNAAAGSATPDVAAAFPLDGRASPASMSSRP
ncbi:MAG: hypothetical protein MZW92_53520 [Comamonadaceae bacterium]|nr:hypothetical protein [Comamonadaceae bacterium]